MYEFYLGLDITDARKEAVLSLVEKSARNEDDTRAIYHLHRLEHYEAGTSGEELARHIYRVIGQEPYVGKTVLVINKADKTGRRAAEFFQKQGLSPVGVILTGGDGDAETLEGLSASEHELVASIERLYRSGRLRMETDKSEGTSLLARGLESYLFHAVDGQESDMELDEDMEIDDALALDGRADQAKRDAEYSGEVLSVALACWVGELHSFDPTDHLAGTPPGIGEEKRKMRPDVTRRFVAPGSKFKVR